MPADTDNRTLNRTLRTGYTTGACAALAAGAATRLLLTGTALESSTIFTPSGVRVEARVEVARLTDGVAECAVRKDAGDDPDVTDGILVHVTAAKSAVPGIHIDGGVGVGRVTRPGLDQPVGAAAINSVPRAMIEREVDAARAECGHDAGIDIVVSVPGGEELAARTFNPHLGVVGGISIIGTTGVVNPMSARALLDAVAVEMNVLRAEGRNSLTLVPGNYGESFARSFPALASSRPVKCANFLGEALDRAKAAGFRRIIVAGHVGKLVKLSGGIMDTHSRVADCRMELLALHAALAGASSSDIHAVLDAVAADEALAVLDRAQLRDAAIRGMLERIDRYLERRLGVAPPAGAVVFGGAGLLGVSPRGEAILQDWESA